jgi:hypothetical protein
MAYGLRRLPKLSVALGGLLVAAVLMVLLGSPVRAMASTSPYCGGQVLGNGGYCSGAVRTQYAVGGWGEQHSVCVYVNAGGEGGLGYACSSGPGAGVYSPLGSNVYGLPGIFNNAAGNNTVYGTSYQP